jgi:hypothetical protein
LDAVVERRAQRGKRATHVRIDRVCGMVLHHRHVLVRGGMEDHDRPILGDDAPHRVERRGVREASLQSRAVVSATGRRARVALAQQGQLAIDVVERTLGAIEEDQSSRVELVDLPSQLRSDRAAGPGDEHRFAPHDVAEARLVDDHRLSAEEVLDLDLADRRGTRVDRRRARQGTAPSVSRARARSLPRPPAGPRRPKLMGSRMSTRRAPVTRTTSWRFASDPRTLWPRRIWLRFRGSSSSRADDPHPEPVRCSSDGPKHGRADVSGPVDQGRDGTHRPVRARASAPIRVSWAPALQSVDARIRNGAPPIPASVNKPSSTKNERGKRPTAVVVPSTPSGTRTP